ncbi:helix-turn-helix domain-containing protein [Reyranella sp.]|uniref:helix-turn-helix domain-containing protein n=1 Tax=Reyranella sp. TaxID=1929291 RepID=UPI0009E8C1E5
MKKEQSDAVKPAAEVEGNAQARDPLDVHIGKQLRRRRRALRIRLKKLSKDVGVSIRQLQRYELGSNRAIARRLFDFARTLNVSPCYFFEGYGEPMCRVSKGRASDEEAAMAIGHSSRESLTLLRAYHKVESPHLRQEILRMALDLEGL